MRPRDLLTKIVRTIEAPPKQEPPKDAYGGWGDNSNAGVPSEAEQRREGMKVVAELYRQQDERRRRGETGQIMDIHLGTGG